MVDNTRSKPAIMRGNQLNNFVPHVTFKSSAPWKQEMGAPQLKITAAIREQAKAIAAAITAKPVNGKRATRRAVESGVTAELSMNPVPTDSNCWLTPKNLIDKVLAALGIAAFSIDAASPGAGLSYIPALQHFTKADPGGCGLQRPWIGQAVWVNCPYDDIEPWVAKADEAVRSGRVGIVVALLPSRVNAGWFAQHVGFRARVLFLPSRVRFYAEVGKPGGQPKFGSMLCVWGGTPDQIAALEQAFLAVSVGRPERHDRPVSSAEEQHSNDVAPVFPETDVGDGEKQERLRTIDLFSGGGSVHLAMEAAGFTTAFANDFCPEKRETFATNFPHVRLDGRSITDVRGHELPRAGTMLGCPPCQDHTKSGRRLGYAGERGILAFEVVRLVRELAVLGRAPGVVVFENVLGLLELDDGKDFAALVEAMMIEGYDVGALVIDAKLFVPQSRRRVFIVAVRSGTPLPPGLKAGRLSQRWHPLLLRRAHEALSAGARRCWHWWTIPMPPRRTTMLADLLEPATAVEGWLPEAKVAGMVALLPATEHAKIERALEKGIHVGIIKERRKGLDARQVRHSEMFFDGCARCLQKSEGGNRQRLVFLDGAAPSGMRIRDFTPRERARLTGLPEDYVLPGNRRSRQLAGDAVVVPVYEWLARHLILPLAEATEACRKKAAVVPVLAKRVGHYHFGPGGARDAMGQVIVKPGANRPSKQVSVRTEVTNLLEADIEIEAHAREEGVSKAELYRRAYNFYRHNQGKAPLPGYVPLSRSPELRPKAVRDAHARQRGRRTREIGSDNGAGEGVISPPLQLVRNIFRAARRPVLGRTMAAQRPGTCCVSFPRFARWVRRNNLRPTLILDSSRASSIRLSRQPACQAGLSPGRQLAG